MLEFDFGTYNDVKNAVNNANIMRYTLMGGQAVACIWIIVKFINAFIKDTIEGQNRITNLVESGALLFFVVLAPHVMDIIDDTFSVVEDYIQEFNGQKLPESLKGLLTTLFSSDTESESSGYIDWFISVLEMSFSDVMLGLFNLFLGIVGFIFWAIDNAVFAIFYMERLIVVELYRFLFPLFVAFVGFDGLRDRYYKWVVSYIGVLLLPIPYIAVHNAIDAISYMLLEKNNSEIESLNVLVTIIVLISSIGMKFKILSSIGRKMSKILS